MFFSFKRLIAHDLFFTLFISIKLKVHVYTKVIDLGDIFFVEIYNLSNIGLLNFDIFNKY